MIEGPDMSDGHDWVVEGRVRVCARCGGKQFLRADFNRFEVMRGAWIGSELAPCGPVSVKRVRRKAGRPVERTEPRARVMALIADGTPGTAVDLGPLMGKDARLMSAMLCSMEQAGLLVRVGSAPSRRRGRPRTLFQVRQREAP